MITELPDINVLVALHFEDHEHHVTATAWFNEGNRFALTALTETGFARIAMNAKAVPDPFSGAEALEALRRLHHHPRADFWADDTSLVTSSTAQRALSGHLQVTDLHLPNLATSRGSVLVTLDTKIKSALSASERRHLRSLARREA